MKLLANVVGFQLVWMAAVGGAAQGWWWLGPLALVLFAALQLRLSEQRSSDLRLLALSAVLGFLLDSGWVLLGLMQFSTPWPWPQVAPVWIVAMWCGFALTLNHSMASLQQRLWLSALLGLFGGPLAYLAAERAWQAVQLQPGWAPHIALGLAWAVVTPALLRLARCWRRPTATPSA